MAQNNRKVALAFGAHPDDAEFLCAGTLALLHERGWEVHISTMTPGDCGTVQYNREEISRIRRAEAAKAVSILRGTYHCLESDDLFIMYDRPTLLKAVEVVRRVRPMIVFTLSPADYMIDHETASRLALSACFACGVVNIETPGADPFEPTPYLYYMDPIEAKDAFGRPVEPGMIIDIGSAMETKEQMLCCHESQRHWLMEHHGMDNYVNMMKELAAHRGREAGCTYGEGFRQHLGHAYPQDNILLTELGDCVHVRQGEP